MHESFLGGFSLLFDNLSLDSLITDHINLVVFYQDSSASMVIEIFEIINIHGYHLALIELLDVLEYRMTYVDSIHIVPLKHHIEGVTRQWRPLLSLQHQASIPDRTTIAIEELAKFRLSLALLALLEKHTADRIVDHRNRRLRS